MCKPSENVEEYDEKEKEVWCTGYTMGTQSEGKGWVGVRVPTDDSICSYARGSNVSSAEVMRAAALPSMLRSTTLPITRLAPSA